ncbi:MAG: RIP metalloprotease RseP [Deltaproteobacteria bacterium]|nr:RIP metalloprotease RseP [Deltaproteobacteria bacterium]
MTTSIFAFIIVLGILIFFHELGHFLVARLFGVGVEKFSLGFGPRVFGKKIGITDYRVSAIPLGGYVKMVGEEPDTQIDPKDIPISFTHKHVFKRILIVAAGPFFNFLLAAVIFFVMFQIYGIFILKPSIGSVLDGKPAQKAGLMKGDMIVAIDGTRVEQWEDMANLIALSDGRQIEVTVRRGESEFDVPIVPELKIDKIFGAEIKSYIIGIGSGSDGFVKKLNPFQAFSESISETWKWTKRTVIGIARLIKGTESVKTIGGPILIAQMAGHYAKKGVASLSFFIAIISITLAIINFLPIPVLDGGHLLFFFLEAVTGRPVSVKVREVAQQAGMFILLMLMIFVFYNDIARIFFN